MKKIAILTRSIFTVGGEQRVVSVIANELAKTFTVTIFTEDQELADRTLYDLSEKIKIVHFNPFETSLNNKIAQFGYWHFPQITRNLYWIIKEGFYNKKTINKLVGELDGKFDVAIAVSGDYSILLGYAADKLKNIQTIGWEHNSYEAYFEMPKRYYYSKYKCFAESIKKLDTCVVLNEYIAQKYKDSFNVDCNVIYNPRSFTSSRKSDLCNHQFIACGRFDTQKGFDLLIDSFQYFSKFDLDWKLVLVGDGKNRKEIVNKIKNYGLENRVIMPGYVSNIKDYLLESSVYLLSSRWEGFPMSITEAYETGLPVISYDITAVQPLMKNGEGLTVSSFDTKLFGEAMVELASNADLRKKMAEKAIETANSLSIKNIVNQWLDILNI